MQHAAVKCGSRRRRAIRGIHRTFVIFFGFGKKIASLLVSNPSGETFFVQRDMSSYYWVRAALLPSLSKSGKFEPELSKDTTPHKSANSNSTACGSLRNASYPDIPQTNKRISNLALFGYATYLSATGASASRCYTHSPPHLTPLDMPEIQFIRNEKHFSAILASNKYLVVNFTASWCGPCQAIKPMIDALYQEDKYKNVQIIRVDLDQCQSIAQKYQISSVPAFCIFEDGKQTQTLQGYSPQLRVAIENLSDRADADPASHGRLNGSTEFVGAASAAFAKQIKQMAPKGFDPINDVIHFQDLIALNTTPLSSEVLDVRTAFKFDSKDSVIYSDADSQMLFFIPLNNICKVHSIFIKVSKPDLSVALDLSAQEIEEECQRPNLVKLWVNKPSILSFEDSTSLEATHEERLAEPNADGWFEIPLKYVRFQKVQNLNLFIDGEDEDYHTVVEKIVLVGVTGDSTEHATLPQDEE